MAYMSQEKKAQLAVGIKAVLKKYGMKGTIGVNNHSTLVVNISQGPLDIIGNMYEIAMTKPDSYYAREKLMPPTHFRVNECWIERHYSGKVLEFMTELEVAVNIGNHDRSDIQTDYFDVGWFVNINIGKWDKPYRFVK